MSDDKATKPQQPERQQKSDVPASTPGTDRASDRTGMELSQMDDHPRPVLHGDAAVPPTVTRRSDPGSATYTGLVGFMRLACFVLTRRVKLARMKGVLSRLERERAEAYVSLGRKALDQKVEHAEIAPLATQIEGMDKEIAVKREEIKAVEAESLSEDAEVRRAEQNLQKVKIGKQEDAIRGIESRAKPLLDEIGHIVVKYRLHAEAFRGELESIAGAEGAVAEQQEEIARTNEEYELVSPGTRAMAYGFWGVLAAAILIALALGTRGCGEGGP